MFARVWWVSVFLFAAATMQPAAAQPNSDPLAWPEITQSARPWTRWWWHGSAVDNANITRLLEAYKAAGLGGVEITCIYGVRGAENRELQYLSPEWLAAVRHTLSEAKRLGLDVDLPTGSGWRMGGPSVAEEDGNRQLALRGEAVAGGSAFSATYQAPRPQAVVANGPNGQIIELTDKIDAEGKLSWTSPTGDWTVYTAAQRWSRDNVKRPAPGGEGRNINPYSRRPLDNYLKYFAAKMGDLPQAGIRAQFHDSFEYEGNWCDEFFAEFEKRRGYKLQTQLPAMDGKGDPDLVARVKHDYRETLSDLVLDNLIQPWAEWSRAHGMLARNQSHGSPANWLDLYGAVDIPETESFGRLVGGDGHPLMFKFASSAAHVMGRPLVSSETATWLDEHYNVTLAQVKEMVDRQLMSGINHVLYHGTAYSPADAAWPGWVFYASSQLNTQNPIWRDFPALNAYVTRCQSMLQSTKADNDVLVYWPIHDTWQSAAGLRMDLRVHNAPEWLLGTQFGRFAEWLSDRGYTFDYISDRQIGRCDVSDGQIKTPGGQYTTIVVPDAKTLPLATLKKLMSLAEAGATIVFANSLPGGAPGYETDASRAAWNAAIAPLISELTGGLQTASSQTWLQQAKVGRGRAVLSSDWAALMAEAKVARETMHEVGGVSFVRHASGSGHVYLLRNETKEIVDQWIAPAVAWQSAIIMDPLTGHAGAAAVRAHGTDARQLHIQLTPGQTLFVKTLRDSATVASKWQYQGRQAASAQALAGTWSVEFAEGGPELPPTAKIDNLDTWTKFAGEAGERFAGTARYSISFDAPAAGNYMLDLGKVAESARVEINGKPVATLIAPPYTAEIDLKAQGNQLVVEVTSVAANRIRDLDRRRVEWKIFKDINIVGINYRPLDASRWPVREAGLLGPVTISQMSSMARE